MVSIIAFICNSILWYMGWCRPSEEFRYIIKSNPKAVVIYPHTSYWDYFIFILYRSANMDIFGNFHTLFAVRFYSKWGWFLSRVGSVPIENKVRKQGQTAVLVNRFKDVSNAHIFMSPKGTSSKAPWRTGYYYLAKELKWPIIVCGLNYKLHKISANNVVNINDNNVSDISDINIVKQQLVESFGQISQLYPENDPDVNYQYKGKTTIISEDAADNMRILFTCVIIIVGVLLLGFHII